MNPLRALRDQSTTIIEYPRFSTAEAGVAHRVDLQEHLEYVLDCCICEQDAQGRHVYREGDTCYLLQDPAMASTFDAAYAIQTAHYTVLSNVTTVASDGGPVAGLGSPEALRRACAPDVSRYRAQAAQALEQLAAQGFDLPAPAGVTELVSVNAATDLDSAGPELRDLRQRSADARTLARAAHAAVVEGAGDRQRAFDLAGEIAALERGGSGPGTAPQAATPLRAIDAWCRAEEETAMTVRAAEQGESADLKHLDLSGAEVLDLLMDGGLVFPSSDPLDDEGAAHQWLESEPYNDPYNGTWEHATLSFAEAAAARAGVIDHAEHGEALRPDAAAVAQHRTMMFNALLGFHLEEWERRYGTAPATAAVAP